MKNEIENLKAENLALKNNTRKENKKSKENDNIEKPLTVHYETDEDELSVETGWILNKRPSKKRKALNSPESESKTAYKLNQMLAIMKKIKCHYRVKKNWKNSSPTSNNNNRS